MTKLIAVTVSFDFVFAVDDDISSHEYKDIAREYVKEAAGDLNCEQFDVSTRAYAAGTVSEWDEACLPYGGNGEMRTADYLRAA